MGKGLGAGYAQASAPFELALPANLVGDRGIEEVVMKTLFLTLGGEEQFSKQALCPLVALGGIDGQRTDDGLGNRNGDLAVAFLEPDGAVSLLHCLHVFLVEAGNFDLLRLLLGT